MLKKVTFHLYTVAIAAFYSQVVFYCSAQLNLNQPSLSLREAVGKLETGFLMSHHLPKTVNM